MSTNPEVWRVSTVEGLFETDLETLKQWIREDCVLPTDKVSKGNLNWIDAGRVPQLKAAFRGEATSAPKPVSNSFEAFVEANFDSNNPPNFSTEAKAWKEPATVAAPASASANTNGCQNHPEATPEYVCRMCSAVFCEDCPTFARERVPICPLCGDLCHKYREVTERVERAKLQSSGFGVEDFVRAIRYPFQHKIALLSGALIYAVLLLAGTRGVLAASTVMFGCISHVICHVAWGRFNRSFMPDFGSFSIVDDFLSPVCLGFGIMVVTWGPVIVLILALMFGAIGGGHSEAANQTAQANAPDMSVLLDPNADPKRLEEENNKLQQLRPGAQIAREAEKSKEEASDPAGVLAQVMPYMRGTTIGLLLVLFILWGVFYHPMALAVAGYTQSLGAVLNPLIGLDTIRRMGTTYFKAFAMVLVVQVISLVVGAIITVVTAPLALPFMGNMVGNFVDATFTFYLNLVIACILGLSLFKCADRLDIAVD
jgi:hypothetical protein